MAKDGEQVEPKEKVSSGRISEFFMHLVAYGGFDVNNGVIYMWGDPYLFIPVEAFYDLQENIYKYLKKDGLDLLYWIGKVSGRNATIALIKKYGFNVKDLPMFVNGATQDGFGYFTINDLKMDKAPRVAHLSSSNCAVAEAFLHNQKKSKIAVDSYISGLIAGGSEPLVNLFVKSEEIKCKAKGDAECLFELTELKSNEKFSFMKKARLNFDDLEKKSLRLYLSRRKQKILGSKEFPVDFGKGEFYLNNIRGSVIASYIMSIFYVTLQKLLSKKEYEDLVDSFCKTSIESIFKTIKVPSKFTERMANLKDELKVLDIFGFGAFRLKYSQRNVLVIENEGNSYPLDYAYLFGYRKEPVDLIPQNLLKYFLQTYVGNKFEVKEITCKVQRAKSCLFECRPN